MEKDLISIIIPVYNTAPYLERCIGSVQKNTYKNIEMICVNDGSTDESLDILKHMSAADQRIRVLSQENQGLSMARNTGLRMAKGEWIVYLDSDDWLHKKFLEYSLYAAKKSCASVVITDRAYRCDDQTEEEDDSGNTEIQIFKHDKMSTVRALSNFVTGKLYRHDLVKDLMFYPVCRGEDTAYNAMLVANSRELFTVAAVKEPLYYYFVGRSDSLVANSEPEDYLRQAKWYLDNMQLFQITDFAVKHAVSKVVQYRYVGSFCANPATAKENAEKYIRKCLSELRRNQTCSLHLRLYLLLICASPRLYRRVLLLRDPSCKEAEKYMTERLASVKLYRWEES